MGMRRARPTSPRLSPKSAPRGLIRCDHLLRAPMSGALRPRAAAHGRRRKCGSPSKPLALNYDNYDMDRVYSFFPPASCHPAIGRSHMKPYNE